MMRETNRFSGYTDDNQTVIIFEFTTTFADSNGAAGTLEADGIKSLSTRTGQAVTLESQGVYRIVATGQIVRTFDGRIRKP